MGAVLHHGDCLGVMAGLDADSVDTIITDPPYGLTFMGKDWDHGVPGAAFWREARRVAKPGAMLLAFGGTRTYHRLACAIEDAGWEVRDCLMWLYGSGFPKSHNLKGDWHGWGTALKPAWEPILLAMKPCDGTFAANAERWGVAGLNVDGGRIPTTDTWSGGTYGGCFGNGKPVTNPDPHPSGRWPANLLLDEGAAAMLGEPARFFYVAKPSRAERNAGLEGMPTETCTGGGGTNNYEAARKYGSIKTPNSQNHHPTVKPVRLMEYLCTLTATPTGGTVLDPFCGSGTTGIAAVNTGRDFIGIEQDSEYIEIARRRIAHAEAQLGIFAGAGHGQTQTGT